MPLDLNGVNSVEVDLSDAMLYVEIGNGRLRPEQSEVLSGWI